MKRWKIWKLGACLTSPVTLSTGEKSSSYKRNYPNQSTADGRSKITQPTINVATATLDEMSFFLAERLEGLRRLHNQRIPWHVAHATDCTCQPPCYTGFDRHWMPAEPHIETLLEAMCQAGYWYITALRAEEKLTGYYWRFGRQNTPEHTGFDAISPLMAAYRAAVGAVLAGKNE